MTEPPDPLEAELAALQPPGPSPELRRRIGERLATRRRRLTMIALAGGLAAAGVAAALLWWAVGPGLDTQPTVAQTALAPPVALDEAGPPLRPNRLTLTRSPENVDALLDRDAATRSGPAPLIHAFTRSNVEITALLGEP